MASAINVTFDTVYQDLHLPIYRYLARLVSDEYADDLTQEVFVSVNENLHTLNDPNRLKAWVYRIASRQAADWFRRQNNQEIRLSDIDSGNNWELVNLDGVDEPDFNENFHTQAIDQELESNEMHDCVQAYLNQLPTQYREVIVLSEFEGFKNLEIAKILGVSLDTVKIRIHRARTNLKHAFQSGCNLYYDESCEFTCEPKSLYEIPSKTNRNDS